jgi:phage shock protein A
MTVNFDFCSRRAKELIRDGEKELAKELIEKSIEYLNNLERHDNDSSQ